MENKTVLATKLRVARKMLEECKPDLIDPKLKGYLLSVLKEPDFDISKALDACAGEWFNILQDFRNTDLKGE